MIRRTLVVGVVAIATILAGCGAIEKKSRTAKLDRAVQGYAAAIRWGDIETVSGFLRPRKSDSPLPNLAMLRNIRVTSYQARVGASGPDADEARMVASFEYQKASSARLKSITQTALWWYDAETEGWFLDGSIPDF